MSPKPKAPSVVPARPAPAVCRNARRESSIFMEFPPEVDAPKGIPNQEFKAIFEPNQINVKQSDACSAARAKHRIRIAIPSAPDQPRYT